MNSERFIRGKDKLAEVCGQPGEKAIESIKSIAPAVDKYIVEFGFGDIYSRDGLSLQEREMITITSLLTQGSCDAQLEFHINAALNTGIPAEKILEIFIHCIPYTGFPRVRNAVTVAKKVFFEKSIVVKQL